MIPGLVLTQASDKMPALENKFEDTAHCNQHLSCFWIGRRAATAIRITARVPGAAAAS